MNRSALFMVTSDPLKNHRPSEAVRIASGILPWKKIKVQIYFHRPFVQALINHPEDLLGQDHIQRYFPILEQEPNTVFGPDDLGAEFEMAGNYLKLNPITSTNLDDIRANSTWLLHF